MELGSGPGLPCRLGVLPGQLVGTVVGIAGGGPAGGRVRHRCQDTAVVVLVGYGVPVFVGLFGYTTLFIIFILYLIPIAVVNSCAVVCPAGIAVAWQSTAADLDTVAQGETIGSRASGNGF